MENKKKVSQLESSFKNQLGISEDLNRRIDENVRFCKAIKEQVEQLEIQAAEARQTDPVINISYDLELIKYK